MSKRHVMRWYQFLHIPDEFYCKKVYEPCIIILIWSNVYFLFSVKKRHKAPPPPITELPSSTLPAKKGLTKWNSTPVIHQDFSELTFPLARKVPDVGKLGRKTFLRSTEHILATFYGLVFIIEGADWHSLKSGYLPIYFVRVSVKNVKYPFRILVIDSEGENHIRVGNF